MVSGEIPKALLRQGGGCGLTPENFVDYLPMHKGSEDRHYLLGSKLTANEVESSQDPAVIELRGLVKEVRTEIYRMRGFVRLAPLGEQVLYGFREPEHRIGPNVAGRFAYRFPKTIVVLGNRRESWVAFYGGGSVLYAGSGGLNATVDRLRELLGVENLAKNIEELWQTYYQSQYTPGRRNMRLFHHHMPQKSLRKTGAVAEQTEDGCTTLDDFL